MIESRELHDSGFLPLDPSAIKAASGLFVGAPVSRHVGSIVPTGYERYCRVLHPPSLPDPINDLHPATWSDLANALGLDVHEIVDGGSLVREYTRQVGWVEEPNIGSFTEMTTVGERINYRLRVGQLVSALPCDRSTLNVGFSTLVDQSQVVAHDFPRAFLGLREFWLTSTGDASSIDSLDWFTGAIWCPELRWWVASDIDLDYTLVGGTENVIESFLANDRFESTVIEP